MDHLQEASEILSPISLKIKKKNKEEDNFDHPRLKFLLIRIKLIKG